MADIYILGVYLGKDVLNMSIVKNGHIVIDKFSDKFESNNISSIINVYNKILEIAKFDSKDIDAITYYSKKDNLEVPDFSAKLAVELQIPNLDISDKNIFAHTNWLYFENEQNNTNIQDKLPEFPILNLHISNTNTEIQIVHSFSEINNASTSKGVSVGKLFDEIAEELNFDNDIKLNIEGHSQEGDASTFDFEQNQQQDKDFTFDFEDLKKKVIDKYRNEIIKFDTYNEDLKLELEKNLKCDIAASLQEEVINILITKLFAAALLAKAKVVTLSGELSQNRRLREKVIRIADRENIDVQYPEDEFIKDYSSATAGVGYYLV